MEIALDVTDIKNKQAELEDVYKIEHFVQQCLVMLHRSKNLDDNIQDVLEAMGTFLQAERAYIFGINFEDKTETYLRTLTSKFNLPLEYRQVKIDD